MRAMRMFAIAFLVGLAGFHPAAAQDAGQPPLSAEAFQKLKQRALQESKTITIPPEAKKVLRLDAGLAECKQLVAGDLTRKYYFIVSIGKNSDDIFLSTQDGNGDVKMFLTNSKLELRNVVTGARNKNLTGVPNPGAFEEDFKAALAIWSQVAAGL
jgi:hypothetical protein